MKLAIKLLTAVIVSSLAVMLFIYPAIVITVALNDDTLRETGQSRLVPHWFKATARRYTSWADDYLETSYAASLYHDNVAATEWPMFGSVFFLVTADDLQAQGLIDASADPVADAIEKAARIVVSPDTATWVRTKWGDDYLERENVFYRMLLILGLASYERVTGDRQYRPLMSSQRKSLAGELEAASLYLGDDYPGECYPNDVLWAVAAIQRAAALEQTNHNELAERLIDVYDGPIKATEGLPAFQVDARSGRILQGARGCGNSGILPFAFELDPKTAAKWYDAYAAGFWKDNGWITGFTEEPLGSTQGFMDVDSGPVLFELGSVASAFGIGASRAAGRLDHTVPLTLEAIACSWPTPFGFLVPGLMGTLAADSWPLGETALLFSMTRSIRSETVTPYQGGIPYAVCALLLLYAGLGAFFLIMEIRALKRYLNTEPDNTVKACDAIRKDTP
jgi:hypothetical protein